MKEQKQPDDIKAEQISLYLNVLQTLNESTEDYLYLLELQTGKSWFFGGIEKKFDLNKNNDLPYWASPDYQDIVHPQDRPALSEDIDAICQGKGAVHDMDYRLRDREGSYVWVNCRGTAQPDPEGNPFVLIGRVSETAMLHKIDRLTGLFNYDRMAEDLLSVGGQGFLLLFGIDNLKNINMLHGRKIGDKTLQFMAGTLGETFDFRNIYRLQGDLFAVIMPSASQKEAEDYYHLIQTSVSAHFTVSCGAVSLSGVSAADIRKTYQQAEYTLEKAKKSGKNSIIFFVPEEYQEKVSSVQLLEELEDSVKSGFSGFSLVYQPQLKVGSYHLFGAESLLRYESPVRGRVFPDEFIPILEETELICPVGLWVLETALAQCARWRKHMPDFHISVNISYIQLSQPDIKEQVLDALERNGLPGKALTLEVTESMQLQNFQYYNEIFSAWKDAGILISVDDFGTGYSSLGYLKHLKINEIKIDRCFISGIHNNGYNYQLLSNMVELASGTQICVCCEGVEEKEELQVLEELKPDLLQGYLFSRPCEETDFERMYFDHTTEEYQQYQQRIGQVQKKSFGGLLNLRHREILRTTNMGLWIIRVVGTEGRNEMFADETMSRIMGAGRSLSPEECYRFWYSRIREDCLDYVNGRVGRAISTGEIIQLQYFWNHPEQGEVTVRCTAVRADDVDGMVCLQGYHRIISDLDQTVFGE